MDFEKTVGNLEPKKFKETLDDSDTMDKSQDKIFGQRAKIKSDRNEDDYDHRFKRSRSSDESHDRKKEKSLCSRHHSPSRDRERAEKDSHRSSREFSDRDKDRDEENGRRKENDRYKVKNRERDRDKDRNIDKSGHTREYGRQRDWERKQERSHRRNSYSERHQEEQVRERSWDRERSHEVEYRERERESNSRERDQGNKRIIEKKEEVAEPEADPERDQRTVFAYQISVRADDRDVYEFFSRAGKVRDVRLIIDHNSRRSKGVGYIEFYDAMSVPTALALSGHPLLGQPVMVKPSEAEKNLFTSSAAGAIGLLGPYSEGARRLHVGNLDFSINKNQLRQVFEPFGLVELVQLPCDPESGHSKGYGFVQFARIEDARAAQSLDGQLKIAGRVMKVSAIPDQSGGQEVGDSGGDFDDDEGGDLSVSAQSRTLLTQKLDSTGTSSRFDTRTLGAPVINSPGLNILATQVVCATSAVAPFGRIPVPALAGFSTAGLSIPAAIVPSIDNIGIASECLLLKNMFDPKVESEPNFDQDIREDVEDQCSKFGKLKHIYVDKYSAGFVYLRFENTQSSITAQRALHGRWFAGKMITATYMVPQNYEAKFPESKQDISA